LNHLLCKYVLETLILDLIWEWPQVNVTVKWSKCVCVIVTICNGHSVQKHYWYCCVANDDYDSGPFDVTFDVGDTSAEVSIILNDDIIDERSEEFRLFLKRTDDTPDLVEIVNPMNATGIIDDDDELGMEL